MVLNLPSPRASVGAPTRSRLTGGTIEIDRGVLVAVDRKPTIAAQRASAELLHLGVDLTAARAELRAWEPAIDLDDLAPAPVGLVDRSARREPDQEARGRVPCSISRLRGWLGMWRPRDRTKDGLERQAPLKKTKAPSFGTGPSLGLITRKQTKSARASSRAASPAQACACCRLDGWHRRAMPGHIRYRTCQRPDSTKTFIADKLNGMVHAWAPQKEEAQHQHALSAILC